MLLTLLRDYSGKSREIKKEKKRLYCFGCYSDMCFSGLVHIKILILL